MSVSNLPERIFICGFMGAGKSTIGKEIAEKLEMNYADLDTVIEKEAGKPIPQIFEEEGEDAFRSLERQQLIKAVRNFQGVLSLGGGSLQNQHLVDHLKINGLLIFIETPFSVIFDRILKNKDRPLLLNDDGSHKDKDILEKELKELYEQRLKYYRQSEITIQSDNSTSVDEITSALVRKIRNHVSFN